MQGKQTSSIIKTLILIVVGLGLLYGIIYLTTKKDHIPAELQATIDSLTEANKVLVEKQKQMDSTIQVYSKEVKDVDSKIDNIKEVTTIVREYYHNESRKADSFTLNQVDSFFKYRYSY